MLFYKLYLDRSRVAKRETASDHAGLTTIPSSTRLNVVVHKEWTNGCRVQPRAHSAFEIWYNPTDLKEVAACIHPGPRSR